MKQIIFTLLITCLHLSNIPLSHAQERATPDEAKALAIQAVEHVRNVGKTKAFQDFHDKTGAFHVKDLYVFVNTFDCTFLAHGLNPKLVGRNIWNVKNPNGRFACQDIVETLKGIKSTWTDYVFSDPLTNELAWKRTFSIKENDMIINVGTYSPAQEKVKQ